MSYLRYHVQYLRFFYLFFFIIPTGEVISFSLSVHGLLWFPEIDYFSLVSSIHLFIPWSVRYDRYLICSHVVWIHAANLVFLLLSMC